MGEESFPKTVPGIIALGAAAVAVISLLVKLSVPAVLDTANLILFISAGISAVADVIALGSGDRSMPVLALAAVFIILLILFLCSL